MAKRKRNGRHRKVYKRSKKRYASKRFNSVSVNKFRTTIAPNVMPVKLKFHWYVRKNVADQIYATEIFSGNSINDPVTSSGSNLRPAGYLDYQAIYGKYLVLGSKCKVKFINRSAFSTVCSILPSLTDTGNANGDLYTVPRCVAYTVAPVGNGTNSTCTLKKYMSTRTMFSTDPRDDPNLSGIFGANPVNMWYWIVGLRGRNMIAGEEVDVELEVTLTYYCIMKERLTYQTPDPGP